MSVTFRRDATVDVADPDVPSGVAAGEGGAAAPEVPEVPSGVRTRSQRECTDAAATGDLTRLKRANENGCPWDERTCEAAAEGGHLECLKYLHENGCPWKWWAWQAAARRGHLECLQYFDAHPNFCRESLFKHPGRAVSRRHGLFQTYTTFSRTTHIFVSRRGALRILEELPSDIVIDMFLARALRLGKLKIYIACDNGIVDQATSEFQSLGG